MNERLLTYIENSFLRPLLEIESVTDISFNGESIYYMDNIVGRRKYKETITPEQAMDFVRQIANLSERQFSVASPTLDITVSKYRINAQHSSVVKLRDIKTVSFAIRIASKEIRVKDDKKFMDAKAKKILLDALKEKNSIVISGPTGSGKTELQKYLIANLEEFTRIIIIDNIQEINYVSYSEDLDITSWQISPNIPQASAQELIRNALRNNPDWIVVAESRGKEMADVLNAVMSGHPIITTMHARKIETMPHRIMRLVQMNNHDDPNDILEDIYNHLDYYVYLNRTFSKDKKVVRYIESIARSDGNSLKIIYRKGE